MHLLSFLVSSDFNLIKISQYHFSWFRRTFTISSVNLFDPLFRFSGKISNPVCFDLRLKDFLKIDFLIIFGEIQVGKLICLLIRTTWRHEPGCNYLLYLLVKNTLKVIRMLYIFGLQLSISSFNLPQNEDTQNIPPTLFVLVPFLYISPLWKMVLFAFLTRHKLLLKICAKF